MGAHSKKTLLRQHYEVGLSVGMDTYSSIEDDVLDTVRNIQQQNPEAGM